jgi:SSS family solute:Na+ symporter
VLWGIGFYAAYTFWWQPVGVVTLHYIHFMVIVLASSVAMALLCNRLLGGNAQWIGFGAFSGKAT